MTGVLFRLGVVILVIAGVPVLVVAWIAWALGVLAYAGGRWVITGRTGMDPDQAMFGWLDWLLDHTIDKNRRGS